MKFWDLKKMIGGSSKQFALKFHWNCIKSKSYLFWFILFIFSMTTHFRVFGGRKIADTDKNPMNQESKMFFQSAL